MNKKWFTLLELVVVVVILWILSIIWIIHFKWYEEDSRDSMRVQDVSLMQKSLELFVLDKWFYPKPTNSFEIGYSWWLLWHQWTFWDSVFRLVWKINKKPIDPLFNTEYTYSTTSFQTEYELWWILEWSFLSNNSLFNKTYAYSKYRAFVEWNYNWKFLRTSVWWKNYILALPWVITSDLSNLDISTLINNKSLVYNNRFNLPWSYNKIGADRVWSWWFDYDPWDNLVIFSWSLNELWTSSWKISFVLWLQNVYSEYTIPMDKSFKKLLSFKIEDNELKADRIATNLINSVPQFSKNLISQISKIDWVCWSSNGKIFLETPNNNLCNIWNTTEVLWEGPWTWNCKWKNKWNDVNCIANVWVNWLCWSSDGVKFYEKPTNNLCVNQWNTISIEWNWPWTWTCKWDGWWIDDNCSANIKIDWICWSNHSESFSEVPNSDNLCNFWIQTSVISNDNLWTWNCNWVNDWVDKSCFANIIIDGECWTSNNKRFLSIPSENLCNSWSLYDLESRWWDWFGWKCKWINSTNNANCNASFGLPSSDNVKLWLKVDNLSLNDNSQVNSWQDSSGNNSVTSIWDNKPIYKSSVNWVLWNKPVIKFNWINNYFTNDNLSSISTNKHSIFTVFHPLSNSKEYVLLGFHDGGWGNEEVYFIKDNGNINHVDAFAGDVVISNNNNYGKNVMLSLLLDDSDVIWNINWQEGSGSDSLANTHAKFSIWQEYDSWLSTGNFFNWYIAEIIMYDKIVSEEEKQEIENYLYNKYNFVY